MLIDNYGVTLNQRDTISMARDVLIKKEATASKVCSLQQDEILQRVWVQNGVSCKWTECRQQCWLVLTSTLLDYYMLRYPLRWASDGKGCAYFSGYFKIQRIVNCRPQKLSRSINISDITTEFIVLDLTQKAIQRVWFPPANTYYTKVRVVEHVVYSWAGLQYK